MKNLITGILKKVFNFRRLGIVFALVIAMVVAMFCSEKEIKATPTLSTVVINGQVVKFDAYTINGNNYFKLRDLAKTLKGTEKQFEVVWNEESKTIIMTSNAPYTEVGGEMTSGDGVAKNATLNTRPIYLDGQSVKIAAFTIGWNNYFKLRDVANLLNFGVDWVGDTSTIEIDTSKGYTPEEALPSPSSIVPGEPTVPNTPNWNPEESAKDTVSWMTTNEGFTKASDVGAYYHPSANSSSSTALIAVGPALSGVEKVGIEIVFHAWNSSDYAVWNEDGSVEFETCDIVDETKALFTCLLGAEDASVLYDTIEKTIESHGSGWHTWNKSFSLHGRSVELLCKESGTLKVFLR